MDKLYTGRDIADLYQKYRPTYPDKMMENIIKYLRSHRPDSDLSSTFDLMVDVGCGSAQSTNMFAPYFKNIVGVDASEDQIEFARKQNKFSHIKYLVGKAESLPFDDNSVDLVTCGASVHWFDLEAFFGEVSRILKPNGCLALFSYVNQEMYPLGVDDCESSKATARIIWLLCDLEIEDNLRGKWILKECWNDYENIFKQIPLPSKQREETISFRHQMSFEKACGYLYSAARQQNLKMRRKELEEFFGNVFPSDQGEFDLLKAIESKLKMIWNLNEEKEFCIEWKYFTILASMSRNV
ncbi:ubiquinone biosynthesis O-methyltransferase-like [Clavelina lepadiformis]|uniref:ubiquinone biosynthesis O-methyltransferase-like n=1 Tax=Clavelina lepadiformis TaxID=159417 RepID=UPI004043414B